MFHICTTRNNGIAYLIWSFILRNCGPFASWLDGFYFGPSRGMNDYDFLAESYTGSNIKPDKRYSILPTVLKLVGDCGGKEIVDIGCGGGFFTVPLAELGAGMVYGVDNSPGQLKIAEKVSPHPRVQYVLVDVFTSRIIPVDIVVAPFVPNYARTIPILRHFLQQIYNGLKVGGKVALVVDLPNGKNLKRFGAVKKLLGPMEDKTEIQIELWSGDEKVCSLRSIYFTKETIERLLREIGFADVMWHEPIISEEGMRLMGEDFWEGYTSDPELGYVTANK